MEGSNNNNSRIDWYFNNYRDISNNSPAKSKYYTKHNSNNLSTTPRPRERPRNHPVIITEQTIPGTITLISPADGTTYDHYPRTTYLRWSTPTDVAVDHYYVEIQCYYSGTWGTWHTDTTENTWYTTDFVGAQPGRWRVIANLGNGEWGPWTEYRTFSYTV